MARRSMCVASLCGGLALSNAKLGAVHGFASPLGGMFPIPHGVACARLLAPVTDANVRALRARDADSPALGRYEEIARVITGTPAARAEDLGAWLGDLVEELGIPRLSSYGAHEGDIPRIVAAAKQASSMRGNPIVLTDEALAEAVQASM